MTEKYTKEELSVRLRKTLDNLESAVGDLSIVCDEILLTYLEKKD